MTRLLFAALIWLALAVTSASAAITATACGNNNSPGTTIAISSGTAGAASIPAGSVIVLFVSDKSTTGPAGSVADSAGNSYAAAAGISLNSTNANGFTRVFYSYTGIALNLTGAGTLTYTKASNINAAASCVYLTGAMTSGDPLDTNVTATAAGSSGTITVTSGAPSVANEMLLGLFGNSNGNTFTPASGWPAPPTRINQSTSTQVAGGNQVASTAQTFAPTVSGGNGNWGVAVIGIKPPSLAVLPSLMLLGVGQ